MSEKEKIVTDEIVNVLKKKLGLGEGKLSNNGWKLDYKILNEIQGKMSIEMISLEEIENVLLAMLDTLYPASKQSEENNSLQSQLTSLQEREKEMRGLLESIMRLKTLLQYNDIAAHFGEAQAVNKMINAISDFLNGEQSKNK